MVDPVDLPLVEDPADGIVQLPGRFVVVTDRLLDNDAGIWRHQPVGADFGADRPEQLGRDREVEGADALLAFLERAGEIFPSGSGLRIDRDEVEPFQERLQHTRISLGLGHMLGERRLGRGAVFAVVHRASRYPDDARERGDLAVAVTLEQGGQQLTVGEVARPAEDDKVEGLDGDDAAAHDASEAGLA